MENEKRNYADGSVEPVKMLQGRSGKVSSKRVNGSLAIIGGVVIGIITVIKNPAMGPEVLWPILSAGTILLGAGVLERFGGDKN
ncbi:MAG: hypothetical protein ACPKOI_05605 [Pleomorphochaeta sp.]